MMTADFTTALPSSPQLDPEQRVQYSLGLVLGVDEFQQEQFYHVQRSRQHTRLLHGYGTVCGLQVTTDHSQILVSPGVAVDQLGRVIEVPRAQCADLNLWLSQPQNLFAATASFGSPVGTATAYVELCYRECLTNRVPVPGAPCRSEADSLAPSRVTETFDLRISATRPAATEETAVLEFGALLRRVQITSASMPGTLLTVSEMEQRVRALAEHGSPLDSVPGGPLLVLQQDAEAVLRAAFRVWVTEVRPKLLPSGCGAPEEACIELAELNFTVTPAGVVDTLPAPQIAVQDETRPFLLPTRLLQESLLDLPDETGAQIGSPIVATSTYGVAAAGYVAVGSAASPPAGAAFGGLTVDVAPGVAVNSGILLVRFPGFAAGARYVVKAIPSIEGVALASPAVVPSIAYVGQSTLSGALGLLLSVTDARLGTPVLDAFLGSMRLMIEIAQF